MKILVNDEAVEGGTVSLNMPALLLGNVKSSVLTKELALKEDDVVSIGFDTLSFSLDLLNFVVGEISTETFVSVERKE